MKNTITLLIVLLISIASFAQQGINYKALIKDDLGNTLSNTNITVQFNIRSMSSVGPIVYQEIHMHTTDTNGLLILNIGTDPSPSIGTFVNIDWSADRHFLQTSITYSGGNINLDATEFMAVPYALNLSGLEKLTESAGFANSNTGWRLIGVEPNNYGPIGENAIDLSYSTNASTIIGATGDNSIAIGSNTEASGQYSIAMGFLTKASGTYSFAMGLNTLATKGFASTAMGSGTEASGNISTAMGSGTKAEASYSLAIGRSNIGGFTVNPETNSSGDTQWIEEDPLFEIGNGTNANRNNALTVLKNGKVGIGRHQPSSLLEVAHQNSPPTTSDYTNAFSIHNLVTGSSWQLSTVNAGHLSIYKNGSYRGFFNEVSGVYSSISDRKAKKDITPLENGTLNKVMQLNPVSYLMKDQTDTKRNLGLISQEVQEIFPSITHYVKESDLLTLSYTELIPILIKALQEQQEIIETQNAKDMVQDKAISEQEKTIDSLIARLNTLESKSSN
jgi:hypothetical protein